MRGRPVEPASAGPAGRTGRRRLAFGDRADGFGHDRRATGRWRSARRGRGRVRPIAARLAAGARTARARVAGWIALEAEFRRTFLWLPVMTGLGVAGFFALPVPPTALAATAAALVALAAIAGFLATRDRPVVAAALAATAALAIGLAMAALQATRVAAPVLEREGSFALEGRVLSREIRANGRVRLVVRVAALGDLPPEARPERVRVTALASDPPIGVGQRIRATVRLGPPHGPVQPGGYDSARRLWFDRIGGSGFAYGRPEVVAGPDPPPGLALAAAVARLRAGIAGRIRTALPGPAGEVAAALLVGERGGIPAETTEALRTAGLGHVLAISGLHMALVAGTVYAAARLLLLLVPGLGLRAPVKKIAAAIGLAAGTVYLVLSGASVATQRAYVMLAIGLVAILFERPAITLRTVALAAFVVMALDPVVVTEPGFQMSFAAVVALVAVYERVRVRLPDDGPETDRPPAVAAARFVVVALAGLAATSLVAGLATGPVSAFHFQRVAPLGLLGNLLAMPLVTFLVMPAGVIALVAMPAGLERWPLEAMGAGLDAVIAIATAVSGLTAGQGTIGAVSATGTGLLLAGLLWTALWTSPIRWLGAILVAAGLVALPFGPRPDLLVADDGRTVAARGADGALAVLRDGAGRFAARMWLKADGHRGPVDAAEAAGEARCDALGCVLPLHPGGTAAAPVGGLSTALRAAFAGRSAGERPREGAAPAVAEVVSTHPAVPPRTRRRADGGPLLVAVAERPSALAEDCVRADVVVTRGRLAACPRPVIAIDRDVLAATGAIAIEVARRPARAGRAARFVLTVRAARPSGPRPWQVRPAVTR